MTELSVGPSRSTPRHFIEILTWEPRRDQQFSLRWDLLEVVRADLIGIAREELQVISAKVAPNSPADRSLDPRSLVRLEVNDDGDAEWSLIGGSLHKGVIETEADRVDQEEERQSHRARDARDKALNFKRTIDIHRAPVLGYVDAGHCFQAFVGWSADGTEAISVDIGGDLMHRDTGTQTLNLAALSEQLHVSVHVYDRAQPSTSFCSDVGPRPVEESWRAIRGSVMVQLSPRGAERRVRPTRRATITVAGAEFVNHDGVRVRQTRPIVLTTVIR